jgi:hypothetical protein
MPEASLFLKVDAFGSDALELRVQIQNNVTNPDGLRLDAAIDGTAGAMAVPTTIAKQRIGIRVYVDGALVPELNACRVTRSRSGNIQTWALTVPIHPGATGYAGDWDGNGTGLCKRAVDVYGVYLTSTGYHEIPLIYNGIADNEARETSDGSFVTYTGVDAGGRYDRETTDFILPPGSGIPRERVISIAAKRCGVTEISLEPSGVQMMHEFQMADASFIQPCQEIADVEGRMIQWDRDGNMVWPQYGSGDLVPSTSRWTFTERNFVNGTVRLNQPGELITEITVEGDLQELVGPCGDVTSRVTITTSSLNGPASPAYAQSAGSSYAANTASPTLAEPITVKVETFDTTRRCGIVVYERRTVTEWFNPEVSRYEWNAATDAWDTLGSVYTDDNTDDDSPAYLYSREQWLTTEIDETWHYWFRENFEGPTSDVIDLKPSGLDMGWGLRAPKGWDGRTNGTGFVSANDPDHSYDIDWEGCKIGTISKSQRWYGVRQYVKSRTVAAYPFDIWEEVEPANGWDVLGSKESAVSGGEQFLQTGQIVTLLGTDGRGYQTDEDEFRFEYWDRKGSPYLYGDDTERADEAESLQFVGATYTKFVGSGEQSHDEIVTETNQDDRTIQTVATTGIASYLPAAERIPDSGPTQDTDVYLDDAEEAELYARAYRTKSTPVSVTVTDDTLESCSTRGVHKVQSSYLESEDEADWLARWLIDEARAGIFEGDLAGANFFIEPGDWCGSIRYGQLGLGSTPGRVDEVTWDWKVGTVLNTRIKVLLYP